MPLFGFDEGFSMFDVTPVENLFLSEYLPGAKGDHVRVYLYGLMQAYHPTGEIGLEAMAHELNLSVDEVLAAYRYWERRGLCIRISDNPPAFRYRSLAQVMLTQQKAPQDTAYEEFAEALHAVFGDRRKLHGGETTLAFEWVEEMRLPAEAVLMMIHHLIQTRGVHFSFAAAQKLAVRMAEEKVQSAEDAELFLARDKKVRENSQKLLRRLGKRRSPSEDEMDLCQKWMTQWGFDLADMEAACTETTKGEPTFAYLDGILKGIRERSGGKTGAAAQLARERERVAPLKALLKVLNNKNLTVNPGTLEKYEQMHQLAQEEVILLAGKECAANGGDLDSVLTTLKYWDQKQIKTPAQVQAYLARVHEINGQIAPLYALWNRPAKPTAADRTLWNKWTGDWGFDPETVMAVAPYAQSAQRPMAYLDALLKESHEKGLREPRAIQDHLDKKPAAPGRTVTQQQYTQREHHEDDLKELDDLMKEFDE